MKQSFKSAAAMAMHQSQWEIKAMRFAIPRTRKIRLVAGSHSIDINCGLVVDEGTHLLITAFPGHGGLDQTTPIHSLR
jgi:hypothetical protein